MGKKSILFSFYGSKIWEIARIIVPLHRSFENERSFGDRYVKKHIEPCFFLSHFILIFSINLRITGLFLIQIAQFYIFFSKNLVKSKKSSTFALNMISHASR